MPVCGGSIGIYEEVSVQEQARQLGFEHHRLVHVGFRLGKIPTDKRRSEIASALGPRWPFAQLRSDYRWQEKRYPGRVGNEVRGRGSAGGRPRLQRLRLRSEERRVGKECRSRWWRYGWKRKERESTKKREE